MRVNSFNSKLNLPKFAEKLGYEGYQFVRVPTFGWFAYNRDRSFIGNAFDLVSPRDRDNLYALIAKEKPEYLDFELSYSDLSETKLKYNLLEIQLWNAALNFARKEMQTYKMTYQGEKTLLKDVLAAHGLNGYIDNKVGVVSSAVLEKFNMLPWPKKDVRGKLLLPSYCSPNQACSLDYFSWDNPNALHPLWLNDERGWYGSIGSAKVLSDMKEFSTTSGFIWDYKADYWLGDTITKLSENLDVSDCIRIWIDAKHATFNKSPLTQIIDSGKASELKAHVGKLNFTQLEQVEQATGEKLLPYWKQAREQQIQIGDRVFLKRDNRYYVYKKGNLMEVTNFAVEITRITRSGKNFIRSGFLHYGNQSLPFEMDEKFFSTNHLFQKGIKDKFLMTGLGVPIIHPDFAGRALLIIESFNAGVKIELGAPSEPPSCEPLPSA